MRETRSPVLPSIDMGIASFACAPVSVGSWPSLGGPSGLLHAAIAATVPAMKPRRVSMGAGVHRTYLAGLVCFALACGGAPHATTAPVQRELGTWIDLAG